MSMMKNSVLSYNDAMKLAEQIAINTEKYAKMLEELITLISSQSRTKTIEKDGEKSEKEVEISIDEKTTVILTTDSEYLQYLKDTKEASE